MRRHIVILDDEQDRIEAMLPCLQRGFAEYDVVVFDNAPDTIQWLSSGLERVRLICLDHDLGPNQLRDGAVFDPGTGRDVADYLASRPPVCPVIIHTTNHVAAPGMIRVLNEANWKTSQVSPYGDLEWVGQVWIAEVRQTLVR